MSCGSPMPRGEQIAKPTERDTAWSAFFLAACGSLALTVVALQVGPFQMSN